MTIIPPRRRARRPLLLAGALMLLGLATVHPPRGVAADGRVDEALARVEPGTRTPVIVVLDSQADPRDHRRDPEGLREDMRDVARRTQPAVIRAAVAGWPAAATRGVRRFWLVNAVALKAGPAAIRRLAASPGVAAVVPDPVVRTSEAPEAPAASTASWGLAAIGAPRAASATGLTGRGIRIGSIDTGVDAAHADLRGRIVAWRDFVGSSATPYDDNGHGTHTIGTMVGRGGVGVAPDASVLVAKAMAANGAGRGSAILAAAQWMADPDGDPSTPDQPSVVNNSWGMGATGVTDPWFRPMVRQWLALGIVPVFAAGNTGPGAGSMSSPADYPESFAVGAVDAAGAVAPFSARGPVARSDPDGEGPAAGSAPAKPDIVAPGVGIVSSAAGGGRVAFSGTSMAAPHVAGAAALIRQAAPGLSATAVMDVLRATASDRGVPGVDPAYGYGVLDLPAALARVGASFTAPSSSPAPNRAAPPAQPGPTRARASVTIAQLRRSRRLALAADARLRTIERHVYRAASHQTRRRAAAPVRLRSAELLLTRRISNRTLARARRLARRLGVARRVPRVPVPRLRGPLPLTPGAVRQTDRFAAATLRAVTRVQRATPRQRAAVR
jgi:subtilisin family serine protease